MSEKEPEVYYDSEVQSLWSEGWERMMPIEEVGVERINGYPEKKV